MTPEESDNKRDNEKLLIQLKGFLRASDKVQEPRGKLYDEWEDFQRGNHWGAKIGTDHPSIPLTWYIWDSQVAKVCDRPVKLAVVPQEACDFPLYLKDEAGEDVIDPATGQPAPDMEHPFRKMAEENRAVMGDSLSDSELYAKFMNALLQREWETNRIPSKLYQAASMAAWFSECWPIVGRDDLLSLRGESPIFVDIGHPKRMIKDPDASGQHDDRFRGYKIPRTRGYIRQRWGDEKADDLNGSDTIDGEQRFDNVAPDSEKATVETECWYVRDDSLEKHQADPLVPIDEEDDSTYYELPLYSRGWFKVITAQNEIMEGPVDAGRVPMFWFPWHPVPGKLDALGIMDLYRTMNFQIDQSMYYALENARTTGQNSFFVNEAAFVGKQDQLTNLPGKYVSASEGNMPQNVLAVQGLDVSQSHYQNVNLNRELMEAMSGSQDLKVNSNLPRDASGEFLKEMKAGIASRLAIVRDEQLLRVAKEMARVILDLLLDDDEPITVRLPGVGAPKYVTIIPSALKLDDEEFESKYDIVADGSAAEPHSAMERDQYYDGIIRGLQEMAPPLAELRINLADWSRKDEIRTAMQQFWEFQKEQAQQAQEAAAQAPNEAMIKAQASAAGQNAKDFSQGMQDLSRSMSDIGNRVLALDILLAAVPITIAIAQGQNPDLTGIQDIRNQFLAMTNQPVRGDVVVADDSAPIENSDPQTPVNPGGDIAEDFTEVRQ